MWLEIGGKLNLVVYHGLYHCAPLVESNEIAERKDVINQLWVDLKDLAEARTQALAGAKEIHTFDRDALDTKERIQVY